MDFMIGGMIYAAENVNKEEALTVLKMCIRDRGHL